MLDTEEFPIGDHNWRVITGAGHSPEHAALWCKELNVLISGDQVLPRISTNVSLQCNEPDGDPLRLYLGSLEKFRCLSKDVLILPSHDQPFYGLHQRIDALEKHHGERLEAAYEACIEAKTSRELIPILFKRQLDVLWIHGLVHLFGHDHIKDTSYKKMAAIEMKFLKKLN